MIHYSQELNTGTNKDRVIEAALYWIATSTMQPWDDRIKLKMITSSGAVNAINKNLKLTLHIQK